MEDVSTRYYLLGIPLGHLGHQTLPELCQLLPRVRFCESIEEIEPVAGSTLHDFIDQLVCNLLEVEMEGSKSCDIESFFRRSGIFCRLSSPGKVTETPNESRHLLESDIRVWKKVILAGIVLVEHWDTVVDCSGAHFICKVCSDLWLWLLQLSIPPRPNFAQDGGERLRLLMLSSVDQREGKSVIIGTRDLAKTSDNTEEYNEIIEPPTSYPSCIGWTCTHCTLKNGGDAAFCGACGGHWKRRDVWRCDCDAVCKETKGEGVPENHKDTSLVEHVVTIQKWRSDYVSHRDTYQSIAINKDTELLISFLNNTSADSSLDCLNSLLVEVFRIREEENADDVQNQVFHKEPIRVGRALCANCQWYRPIIQVM